jgi:hypothetical protein
MDNLTRELLRYEAELHRGRVDPEIVARIVAAIDVAARPRPEPDGMQARHHG